MESDHLAIFISFVLFCVVHLVHGTDCIWFSVYLFVINLIKWKSFPIEMIQVWQSLNKSWVRGSRFLWKSISAILFWCIGTKYTKIYILIKWNWFFLPFQWVVRIMNSMLCPFHVYMQIPIYLTQFWNNHQQSGNINFWFLRNRCSSEQLISYRFHQNSSIFRWRND